MHISKFEEQWENALAEFWHLVGESRGEGLSKLPGYLRETHLVALEGSRIVGTAFIMKFDTYYLTISFLSEFKSVVKPLLRHIIELCLQIGIEKLCIAPKDNDFLRSTLLEEGFCLSAMHYRLRCSIGGKVKMPTNVVELRENEMLGITMLAEIFGKEVVENVFEVWQKSHKKAMLGCFEGEVLCGSLLILANPAEPCEAYIPLLGVKKEFRGKGYGKKLLDGAKAWACANGVNVLLISTENAEVAKMYLKAGFKIEEKVEVFCWLPSKSQVNTH